MEIDRRAFFTTLGGAAALGLMSDEAKADALEDYMMTSLDSTIDQQSADGGGAGGPDKEKFPTTAEVDAQIETRPFRRGEGSIFGNGRSNVKRLPPMPAQPTLLDFYKLRFNGVSNHVLQSANRAMKTGMTEEIIFACLLHDVVQTLIKVDHGWWGAQMFEPYVSEKVTFAVRYHQALRFYEDPANGYEYPDLYRRTFGSDYKPDPYIEATYKMVRKHKWYMEPRLVTVNDLYAFDPNVKVTIDPLVDIIGRQFKQPKEGLGYDNSPVAHMWRSMIKPDSPL
jgi:hypothetical protein